MYKAKHQKREISSPSPGPSKRRDYGWGLEQWIQFSFVYVLTIPKTFLKRTILNSLRGLYNVQPLRCSDYCLTGGNPCKPQVLTKSLSFHSKVVTHIVAPGFWVFFNKGTQQTLMPLKVLLFGCNPACQFIWTKYLNFHKTCVVVSLIYCLGPHRIYQIGH